MRYEAETVTEEEQTRVLRKVQLAIADPKTPSIFRETLEGVLESWRNRGELDKVDVETCESIFGQL